MSSFPLHKENVLALKDMGFNVDKALEKGEVTIESWGYDELVDLFDDVICELQNHSFKIKPKAT